MIPHSLRKEAVQLIQEAHQSGARLAPACELIGLTIRTFQRWTQEEGQVREDKRPEAERPVPKNKLSHQERQAVLDVCHRSEFASLPPTQIVPKLADKGEYIASESTFYRVLREEDELHHRGRARKPRKVGPPRSHTASRPNQIWSWDITWLPGPVKGMFYYLYMIIDIYSRKMVGWEVHEVENSELGADVVKRAVLSEKCVGKLEVLHADNGSPQKGSHLAGLLESLGVERSHNRPRVSNDNPYSEAAFRTCKYRPSYPHKGFATLEEARAWVHSFVQWYNVEHQHSSIGYVTPSQRHDGEDREVLAKRKAVFEAAKAKHPQRWKQGIRNFEPVGAVELNPINNQEEKIEALNS